MIWTLWQWILPSIKQYCTLILSEEYRLSMILISISVSRHASLSPCCYHTNWRRREFPFMYISIYKIIMTIVSKTCQVYVVRQNFPMNFLSLTLTCFHDLSLNLTCFPGTPAAWPSCGDEAGDHEDGGLHRGVSGEILGGPARLPDPTGKVRTPEEDTGTGRQPQSQTWVV